MDQSKTWDFSNLSISGGIDFSFMNSSSGSGGDTSTNTSLNSSSSFDDSMMISVSDSSSSSSSSDSVIYYDYDTAFARQIGMHYSQINAQKILGPPYDHKGPAPCTGSEVYVKNLPLDPPSCIPELHYVFKQMGKIYQIRLLVNFSGTPKGFGFILFYSRSVAEKALLCLQGHYLRPDKPLHVQLSVDNHYLTISNLPGDKSDEDIVAAVKSVAGGDVKEVKVQRALCTKSRSVTTTCTIAFGSHKGASNARRDFLSSKIRLWGQSFSAEWAPSGKKGDALIEGRQHFDIRPRRRSYSYRKF